MPGCKISKPLHPKSGTIRIGKQRCSTWRNRLPLKTDRSMQRFIIAQPNSLPRRTILTSWHYEKFIDLFYNTFQDEQMERVSVPYGNSFLSALRFSAVKSKGVIVIHGGSDSFIEEFYSMASYIVDAGYTVIMFEGPGQGATLKKHGLTLTYEWEKPVGTVLDFFDLDNVTLVGVSLGGYLCLRAAAFEPRITKVVAFDIFYDYLNRGDLFAYLFVSLLLNLKMTSYFNTASRKKMQADLRVDWAIRQGMQITGTGTPYEYFKHIQQYSIANQHADKVRQDVLLLAGAKDHFIPLKTYAWQKRALKNARSVTGRVFTEQEQAQNHCQVGNIKLVLDVILEWINQLS